jgi:nucleoside-diphosphate-sugar epimerase
MKVLFIGGTGNISTACSRLALERGFELALLTRGKRALPADLAGARCIHADITDPAAVERALGSEMFDCVVQFIGFTAAEMERDIALFAKRTRQYIFISSASAYQKPLSHPIITESTPLANPFWDYSRAKIASELRLEEACRSQQFPMTIVRPSLTYDTVIPLSIGSWDDYTMVARMRRGSPLVVHGDGSSLWTITHSEDFAKGLIGLIGHQQAIGHSFHITSDEILTWDQIYQAVASAAGVEAKLVHLSSDAIAAAEPWQRGNLHGDKAVSAIFDNSKIKRFVPGFQATISFKAGIKRTIDWFEADPARMKINEGHDRLHDRLIAIANAQTTRTASSGSAP